MSFAFRSTLLSLAGSKNLMLGVESQRPRRKESQRPHSGYLRMNDGRICPLKHVGRTSHWPRVARHGVSRQTFWRLTANVRGTTQWNNLGQCGQKWRFNRSRNSSSPHIGTYLDTQRANRPGGKRGSRVPSSRETVHMTDCETPYLSIGRSYRELCRIAKVLW